MSRPHDMRRSDEAMPEGHARDILAGTLPARSWVSTGCIGGNLQLTLVDTPELFRRHKSMTHAMILLAT